MSAINKQKQSKVKRKVHDTRNFHRSLYKQLKIISNRISAVKRHSIEVILHITVGLQTDYDKYFDRFYT